MGLKVRLAPRGIADLDEIRAYLVARDQRGCRTRATTDGARTCVRATNANFAEPVCKKRC